MCDTTISSSACVRSMNSRISAATVRGAPTNETRDRRSGSPASRRSRSHSFDGGGSWIGRPERRLANDWRPDEDTCLRSWEFAGSLLLSCRKYNVPTLEAAFGFFLSSGNVSRMQFPNRDWSQGATSNAEQIRAVRVVVYRSIRHHDCGDWLKGRAQPMALRREPARMVVRKRGSRLEPCPVTAVS